MWSHEDEVIVTLTIDGEDIETTPEHPFYTSDNEWVPAAELEEGDEVRQANGEVGTVEAISFSDDAQAMYNLTVETAHTYFVGDGQWLVHNACQTTVPLADIRFSQGSAGFTLSDKTTTILDVAENMRRNGWDLSKGAPDIVRMPDDVFTTLDHRRLIAATVAGLEDIPANVHGFGDIITNPNVARRFTLRTNIDEVFDEIHFDYNSRTSPSTWGEAVVFRSANQRLRPETPDFPLYDRFDLPTLYNVPDDVVLPAILTRLRR